MEFKGYVYDQAGDPKVGLTVELWEVGAGAATSSTVTDGDGMWEFNAVAVGAWRIKVIDGLKVLWIEGASEVQVAILDAATSVNTDLLSEHTATNGIVADGVLLKDGNIAVQDSNASHRLTIKTGSDLTAAHNLTFNPGDADRTVTISGDTTISGTNTGDQVLDYGLSFEGTVSTYTDPTHFKASDLAGYGDGYFVNYYAYCVWDAGGAAAAPQGEYVAISGYTSSDGTFTHAAFTTPLAVTDKVLILNPLIALPYINAYNAYSYAYYVGTRTVFHKDQWCDPSAIIPSLAFTDAAADKDFPNVVLPTSFLPANAVIQKVELILKWRKMAESSGSANAINAASKTIRIKLSTGAWGTNDIVAITMVNGGWSMAASATESGDVIIGSADLSSVVTSTFNRTYNIRSEQTNRTDAITVTGASLTLYDVATGLRVWYTLV